MAKIAKEQEQEALANPGKPVEPPKIIIPETMEAEFLVKPVINKAGLGRLLDMMISCY
jgi:hypothetical protein